MFFVSLKGAGAHSSYLAGPHLWMAPDFESWQALALGNAEVFSAQRKIPKVYRAQICREKKIPESEQSIWDVKEARERCGH